MSAGALPLLATCWPDTATVEMSTAITAKMSGANRNRIRICLIKVNPSIGSYSGNRACGQKPPDASPPRVRRHQVVGAIVDDKLAVVLGAVLDGEGPDGGVVGQPVPKEFRCFVQPGVALLLNHLRSVRDRFLHELHHVGFGFENVSRRIVALAEVGPEVGSGNPADQDKIQCGGVE